MVEPARFRALDGGLLTLSGDSAPTFNTYVSTAAIEGMRGRLVLSSGTPAAADTEILQLEGMRPTERYDHSDGAVYLAEGDVYDSDTFEFYGKQHAVVWQKDSRAIWSSSVEEGRKWLLDYYRSLTFEHATGGFQIVPPDAYADWKFSQLVDPKLRVVVTLDDVGVVQVIPDSDFETMRRSATKSQSIAAGELSSYMELRRSTRILFANDDVKLMISVLESTPGSAVDRFAGLESVEWVP